VPCFFNAAIVGIILSTTAPLPSAQDGPAPNVAVTSTAPPARATPPAPAATAAPAVPVAEAIKLDEYLNRLDNWRNEGRITAVEAARARRLLNSAIVGGDRGVRVPLDASGRIDLLALARGPAGAGLASMKPEDRLADRVLNEFDIRMRVTARNIAASPNLAMFDAAPGYAAVPARDLGHIVSGALETTPIGELPGGSRLVNAISILPNTSGVAPTQTFREISSLVGDRQRDWLESRVGSFVKGHKLEAGLLTFAAITSLRYASPGTAHFMDGLGIRLRIFRASTPDARYYATSRLVYRDAHVLPELELETGARHVSGTTTYRVTGATVLGAEAVNHARGRVGFGARWERGRLFADTSATCAYPENLARTELRGGYLADTGLAISAAVAATFGHNSGAIGPASGRLGFELDLSKSIIVRGLAGETSLFVSSGADSNFGYADWRGGLVFRMRLGGTTR
jgi:hypothetical protein